MLAAAFLVLYSTRSGPGLSPDSLKYLLLARSLAGGHGFEIPGASPAHYPPGYPLILAAIGAGSPAGLGPVRILHALLFTLNAGLVLLTAARAGGRAAGLLAALGVLGSPALLAVHTMVWSEPAFLTLLLAAGLLLSAHEESGRIGWLWCAAACLAGATTVRYAGLAFVPAGGLALLLARNDGPRPRWRDVGWLAAALLPIGAWLGRNVLAAGSATNRPWAFHPPGFGALAAFLSAEGELWGLGPHLAAGFAMALATLAAAVALMRGVGRPGAAIRFALLVLAGYPAFLLLSMSFVDADTFFDTRLLAPLHVFAIVLVSAAAVRLTAARAVAATAVAALCLNGLVGSARAAVQLAQGEGFAAPYWRDSETLARLRSSPLPARVFTNGPEVVAAFVGGDVAGLPAWTSRVSLARRPQFQNEMRALCAALRSGGKVVYLEGITWAWDVPSAEELQASCALRVERRFEDGVVLGSTRSPAGSP